MCEHFLNTPPEFMHGVDFQSNIKEKLTGEEVWGMFYNKSICVVGD